MSRELTIVVPFPPGGATSFIANVLASAMADSTGMKVNVEAHTGLFGTNAMRRLLDDPSGNTVMVGSVNTNSIAPVLHSEEFPFDYYKNILPLCRLANYAGVLAAQKESLDLPLAEFIEHLKNTKGRIVYGTDFLGTNIDIDMIKLSAAANVEIVYRVADGALALLNELGRKTIDMTILNVGTMRRELGRYRPLAAISPKERIDYLPNTPTMAEAGFEGIGVNHWLGVFVSRKSSDIVLDSLFSMIIKAMDNSEVHKKIEQTGAEVSVSSSSMQFQRELEVEMLEWKMLKPKVLSIKEIK